MIFEKKNDRKEKSAHFGLKHCKKVLRTYMIAIKHFQKFNLCKNFA
jgi:hypothetical protein